LRLGIVIPAYNEADSVAGVIQNIPRETVAGSVFVVVVDDGSKDRTAQVARRAGADFVVRHPKNLGVGAAFRTGIRTALRKGADIIATIDADQQFDAKEIPTLIEPIRKGEVDFVLGTRFHPTNENPGIPLKKRLGNQLVTLLVSLVVGQQLSDTQTGFRSLSREAAESLSISGIFTYTQEMVLDLTLKGFSLGEVPVKVRYYNNRESRVVKSMPSYAIKATGLILFTVLRLHYQLNLALISTVILFSALAAIITTFF